MLKIKCPWCGPRAEIEFQWGGPAHLAGPVGDVSHGEWADYLYMRDNKKGADKERWCHSQGCRQWFNIVRNTVTHDIKKTYKMGECYEPD